MVVAVYKAEHDTCGNSDFTLLGYCVCDTMEELEKEFPKGFLVGYAFRPIEIYTPRKLKELCGIIK